MHMCWMGLATSGGSLAGPPRSLIQFSTSLSDSLTAFPQALSRQSSKPEVSPQLLSFHPPSPPPPNYPEFLSSLSPMASASRPDPAPRKRSWIGKYKDKDSSSASLPTPQEGRELAYDHPLAASSYASGSSTHTPAGGGLPFKRSSSSVSLDSSTSRPVTPIASSRRGSSSTSLLTKEELDQQASRIILNALDRTNSRQQQQPQQSKNSSNSGSFSKMSLASMMGGLSALSLSRNREERGRSATKEKGKEKARARSSSYAGRDDESDGSASQRARSQSPFRLRRTRTRDSSPTVEALTQSDVESDVEVNRIRPRNNAFSVGQSDGDDDSDDNNSDEDDDSDEGSWSENDQFDPVTEKNTERNALVPADRIENDAVDIPDPLGEGVNVVIPPEPYFPSTLNTGARNPRRRKSTRPQDTLPMVTSRPVFQRDRCTITLTHGAPEKLLEESSRRPKRYVLASDLSDESRYALEWGIGTVLRDGDELYVFNSIQLNPHRLTYTLYQGSLLPSSKMKIKSIPSFRIQTTV